MLNLGQISLQFPRAMNFYHSTGMSCDSMNDFCLRETEYHLRSSLESY
jgi:hypothetical protein